MESLPIYFAGFGLREHFVESFYLFDEELDHVIDFLSDFFNTIIVLSPDNSLS